VGSDGNASAPPGPDLGAGIPADSVTEGAVVAGRVGDEAVMVTRVDGRCHALGATCTHYGAPLAEGLIVGGVVRCPWHHAAFDLRTGAAERPPALNDLPCWDVEERDGRVRVTGRREPGAPAATPARAPAPNARRRAAPESVVIVGASAAGVVAAETLRREGYAGPITVIDQDRDGPVDRPNLSKDFLAGSAPEEWLPLRPASFFGDHEIVLLTGRTVAALEPRARRVVLRGGEAHAYGALLLATGASPVQLGLDGGRRLRVRYLRTLADCRAIIQAAEGSRRAVVLGASFIGLEVAASLRARGLEVHVVAPDPRPLARVMGPEVGAFVQGLHEAHGVAFRLGRTARELADDAVITDDGERLPADLVVAGVGVLPNDALAADAGIAVDRGILVDRHLETDAPGVFAAGDVARWPDARTGERVRVEHWVVAERQGQAAARSMLGARERFDAVPFFWSAHYDVSIRYVGHAARWDAIEIDGSLERRDCAIRYVADGRTAAVAAIGRDRASLEAELAMERDVPAAEAAG
jgi:3-phenylpropionate/trans-cinnamate dioxygenase ferredoxin reductase subunit